MRGDKKYWFSVVIGEAIAILTVLKRIDPDGAMLRQYVEDRSAFSGLPTFGQEIQAVLVGWVAGFLGSGVFFYVLSWFWMLVR
jgi:hypothetical protein